MGHVGLRRSWLRRYELFCHFEYAVVELKWDGVRRPRSHIFSTKVDAS